MSNENIVTITSLETIVWTGQKCVKQDMKSTKKCVKRILLTLFNGNFSIFFLNNN